MEEANRRKSYKFGDTVIMWTDLPEGHEKSAEVRGLQVLYFADAGTVPREHHMGGQVLNFGPTQRDPVAAKALSALCQALHRSNRVIVARYVSRAGGEPKLLKMWPHIKPEYEVLLAVRIPFVEEVEELVLPRYEHNGTVDAALAAAAEQRTIAAAVAAARPGMEAATKADAKADLAALAAAARSKAIGEAERAQREAMGQLVDQLSLTDASGCASGDRVDGHLPRLTHDPLRQRLKVRALPCAG